MVSPLFFPAGCYDNSTLQTTTNILTATDTRFVLSAQDPALCQAHCATVSTALAASDAGSAGNGTLFYMNGNQCSCYDFPAKASGTSSQFSAAFSSHPPLVTTGCLACTGQSASTYFCGSSTYTQPNAVSVYFASNILNSETTTTLGNIYTSCKSGYRASVNGLVCLPSCTGLDNSPNTVDSSNPDLCACNTGYVYKDAQCQLDRLIGYTSGYTTAELYRGCLTQVSAKFFSNVSTTAVTSSQCVDFCASAFLNYAFIGKISSSTGGPLTLTCGCSNLQAGTFTANDVATMSTCNVRCPTDMTQNCGGNEAFDFYQVTSVTNKLGPFTPSNKQNSTITTVTTGYNGCYKTVGTTQLSSPSVAVNTSMTVQACQIACAYDGSQTALISNGSTCKCLAPVFSAVLSPTTFMTRNAVCNVTCPGAPGTTCGGAVSYDVYTTTYGFVPVVPPATPVVAVNLDKDESFPSVLNPSSNLDISYAGCIDATSFTPVNVPFGDGIMTLELCAAACDAAPPPYNFFAVNAGASCSCSATLPTSNPVPSDCTVPCNGNPAQLCGSVKSTSPPVSGNRASVYSLQYVAPPFLGSTNDTASPAYNLSVVSKGCFQITSANLGPNGLYLNAKQSVATCQNSCLMAGYFVSGVTNGDTCLCAVDTAVTSVFSQSVSSSFCTKKCVGNTAQTCGDSTGAYANVYLTQVVPTSATPLVIDAVSAPYSFKADTGLWADDKTELLSAFCGVPAVGQVSVGWTIATVLYPALLTPQSCATFCLQQFPTSSLSAVFTPSSNQPSPACRCAPYSALTSTTPAKGKCTASCPGNNQLSCGSATDTTIATVSVFSHAGRAAMTETSPYHQSVNITLQHAGCYSLNANLTAPADASSTTFTDPYVCARDCFKYGFVFGFQKGTTCLCSSTIPSSSVISSTPEVSCNTVCTGNTGLTCGGPVNYDVVTYKQTYNTAPVTASTAAPAFKLDSLTGHAANVAYVGCFAASTTGGDAPITSIKVSQSSSETPFPGVPYSSLMTSARCVQACDQTNTLSAKQYAAAMVTAGNQCVCLVTVPSKSAAVTAANSCNVPCGGSALETCGDATNGQVYALNYAVAVTMDTPYAGNDAATAKTQFAGCYLGDTVNFQLNQGGSSTMTVPTCVKACAANKQTYAALQKGNTCFCATSIASVTSAFRYPATCGLPCSGDILTSCGDLQNVDVYYTPLPTDTAVLNYTVPVRMSTVLAPYVFTKSGNSATGAPANATITVLSQGCLSGDQAGFSSYTQAAVSAKMTVQTCASLCANVTMNMYAGLMNSNTCMCGSTVPQSFSNGLTKCTYACSGDATTSCGDNTYMNIYSLSSNMAPSSNNGNGGASSGVPSIIASSSVPPVVSASGSAGVSVSGQGSSSSTPLSSPSVGISVSASASVSASVGVSNSNSNMPVSSITPSFGVSSGVSGSASASSVASTPSISPSGNPSSVSASSSTSISSSSTSSPSSSASSSSSSSSSSVTSQTPPKQQAVIVSAYTSGSTAWTYKSCWGEPQPHNFNNRALGTRLISSGATVQSCLDAATARGFTTAGIEYGGECWATNARLAGGAVPDSYCDMACTSAPGQFCGGDWTLTLYSTPAVAKNKQMVTVNNSRWFYSSCWGEPRVGRALTNPINNNAVGTIESCLQLGFQAGYSLCGLEYGGECWCSKGSLYGGAIDSKYCNMPCKGDSTELCGGGNTLSLYGRG